MLRNVLRDVGTQPMDGMDAITIINGAEDVIVLPVAPTEDSIAPIIFSVPLQMLAYHVAVLKGTDIDQPRNLAKSVTVE